MDAFRALPGAMIVCMSLLCARSAPAQSPVQVIAKAGDSAPGIAEASFGGFAAVVVNSTGSTAFQATLTGPGVTVENDSSLWRAAGGLLSLVARENVQAPLTPVGTRFAEFQFPILNNVGQVAFLGRLRGAVVNSTNEYGIWAGLPGGIQKAFRNGDPVPGIDSVFDVSTAVPIGYSNTGQVVFGGIYDDPALPGSQFGLWAGSPGAIVAVAVPGQQAPGFAQGVEFASALLPAMSPGGQIAFLARVAGPGVTLANDQGIWIGTTATSSRVVAEGSAAPNTTLASYGNPGIPAINDAGQIAFTNTLTGPGVNGDTERAVFAGAPGSISLVAREGGSAHGAPAGVVFDDFNDLSLISGSGAVAAQVKLRGTGVTTENDTGIWASPTGVFTRVAREGDPAPGTSGTFSILNPPTMNFHGQVAFRATLTGAGVDESNNGGIWAVDPFNRLVRVLREGEAARLAPGDDRVLSPTGVSLMTGSGGQDGHSSAFNSASQLALALHFQDGTSAAVLARVGGTARVSDIAPVLGPSAGNGYGLGTPATAGDIVSVSGDAGYIRFADVAPAGSPIQILLDFSGTDAGVAAALAEIRLGEAWYGYQLTELGPGDFQAMLQLTSHGTVPEFFYWNILNIGSVDLQRVQFVPEPATALLLAASLVLVCRRRTGR